MSRFFCVLHCISADSFNRISSAFIFVNNFFSFFTHFFKITTYSVKLNLTYILSALYLCKLPKRCYFFYCQKNTIICMSDDCISGEDGIRTHAPVKTNGFQDRPVMTTSVPLHLLICVEPSDLIILPLCFYFVNTFFKFFQTFL